MQIDYLDIGTRIREARVKKSITQAQLAEKTGLGATHISHVETGNSRFSVKTLISILNALQISADELLCIHIDNSKHAFEAELADVLADCSPRETRIIAEMAKALKDSLRVSH